MKYINEAIKRIQNISIKDFKKSGHAEEEAQFHVLKERIFLDNEENVELDITFLKLETEEEKKLEIIWSNLEIRLRKLEHSYRENYMGIFGKGTTFREHMKSYIVFLEKLKE